MQCRQSSCPPAQAGGHAYSGNCLLRGLVPAEPESGTCIHPTGCSYLFTIDCENGCRAAADEVTRLGQEAEPERPGRLPFTLTYALASGERREVTLAGDVAVRIAEDGALIITHESLTRALAEIRPDKDSA